MSYKFGKKSKNNLATCHEDLQLVANTAISHPDCPCDFGIIWGYRDPEKQFELFKQGRTNVMNQGWVISNKSKVVTYCDGYIKKSKHNYEPSLAFDIGIYINKKLIWDFESYRKMGIFIMIIAEDLFEENKITNKLIWGGIWKKFKDLPHYQI